MDKPYQMFFMRMRPEVRALLDQAADEQRRSRTSILEELIVEAYGKRYETAETRIKRLLGAA
jgi:predicted transcriptional regulator